MRRAPCGLNGRLPDAHVTAAVFSGATVDMPEVLLRTRAKAAAGGEHNRDEKGIALIVLSNSGDSGASAPFALTCAEDAQDRVRASQDTRPGDRGLGDGHTSDLKRDSFVFLAVEVDQSSLVLLSSKAKRRARPLLSKNACAGLCNPPPPGFQAGEE